MFVYLLYLLLAGSIPSLYFTARALRLPPPARYCLCALPLAPLMYMLAGYTEPPAENVFIDYFKAYHPAAFSVLRNPDELFFLYERKDYVNIPLLGWLFTPLAGFSREKIIVIFSALGAASLLPTLLLLIQLGRLEGRWGWALAALALANGPLYYSMRIGNTSHLILLLIVGGVWSLERRREFTAGVLFALAAAIKIPLLLLGVYFVLRLRRKTAAAFIITLLLLGGLSLVLYGALLHQTWYEECVRPFNKRPMAAFNVQSVDGFLARLFTSDRLYNWKPHKLGYAFRAVRYPLVLGLLCGTFALLWKAGRPRTAAETTWEIAIVLTLALLTSPVSWSHYYVLLLLPLALYLGALTRQARLATKEALLFCCAAVLVSLPVILPRPQNTLLAGFVENVWISHYCYGGLIMLYLLLKLRGVGVMPDHKQSVMEGFNRQVID